jgi:coenzyme F420-reducing hydrogenase delta subunit
MTGVAVLGCHLGGCRFNHANHAAIKRLDLLKTLLDATGIGGKRLLVSFGTAHEDYQYAEVVKTFFEVLTTMPSTSSWMAPSVR